MVGNETAHDMKLWSEYVKLLYPRDKLTNTLMNTQFCDPSIFRRDFSSENSNLKKSNRSQNLLLLVTRENKKKIHLTVF